MKPTTHTHLVPMSRMCVAIPPLPQYASVAWCSVKAQRQLYLYLYKICRFAEIENSKLEFPKTYVPQDTVNVCRIFEAFSVVQTMSVHSVQLIEWKGLPKFVCGIVPYSFFMILYILLTLMYNYCKILTHCREASHNKYHCTQPEIALPS